MRYSYFGCSAIFMAVWSYKNLFEGRMFIIFTDHKTLVYAFCNDSDKSREIRQLDFVSQFSTDARTSDGSANVVAFSLLSLNLLHCATVDHPAIDYAHVTDTDSFSIRSSSSTFRFTSPTRQVFVICPSVCSPFSPPRLMSTSVLRLAINFTFFDSHDCEANHQPFCLA